jgi:hypothetical protein
MALAKVAVKVKSRGRLPQQWMALATCRPWPYFHDMDICRLALPSGCKEIKS